jgi:hypothetical protein
MGLVEGELELGSLFILTVFECAYSCFEIKCQTLKSLRTSNQVRIRMGG